MFNTNLKSQCEQRERVQSGEANLCSNVGFKKRLVQDIRLRVAIACVNQHSVTVWGFGHRAGEIGSDSQLLIITDDPLFRARLPLCLCKESALIVFPFNDASFPTLEAQ